MENSTKREENHLDVGAFFKKVKKTYLSSTDPGKKQQGENNLFLTSRKKYDLENVIKQELKQTDD